MRDVGPAAVTASSSSTALPPTLRVLALPMLATVQDLSAQSLGASRSKHGGGRLVEEASRSLAIMGDRGGGKTTLLSAVCEDLARSDRHLVLPVLRPELFGAQDSLTTVFLAELWDEVTREASALNSDAIIRHLAEVARSAAIALTTNAALEHGTESPVDFADDLLTVSRSRVRLAKQLRDLVRHICSDETGLETIIVPVDDPDLSDQPVGVLIRELQVLGSVPGILPIACFSPDDLFAAWVAGPQREDAHANRLRGRQFEKAFPQRNRFEIDPLSEQVRGSFSPIGETRTLKDLLSTLRTRVEAVAAPCFPIDEAFTRGGERYGLANPLPENARTLVQLWESLAAIQENGELDNVHLATRRLIDAVSERAAVRIGARLNRIARLSPSQEEDERRHLALELPRYTLTIGARNAFDIHPHIVASIQLRPISRVSLQLREGTPETLTRLTPEDGSSLLAALDIADGSGLYAYEHPEQEYLYRSEVAFLQEVQLGGQPTDNLFVVFPSASSYSQILRFCELWNRLEEHADALEPQRLFAGAIAASCAWVVGASTFEVPDDYSEALDQATALYSGLTEARGSAAEAFVEWFIFDLPNTWHTAVFSPDEIRSFWKKHAETTAAHPLLEHRRLASQTDVFDARVAPLLDAIEDQSSPFADHNWVAGYFESATALGSPLAARLGSLHRAWNRQTAGYRAGNVVAGSILGPSKPSHAKPAPYVTPESTELLATGLAAVRRALAAERART